MKMILLFIHIICVHCVRCGIKRTNIVLDENMVKQGKELTGLKTSKDLVNFALSQLIQREKQKKY